MQKVPYPMFLSATPKVFGVSIVDIVAMAIAAFLFLQFGVNERYVLLVVTILYLLIVLRRKLLPKKHIELWIQKEKEIPWALVFRRMA